MIGRPAVSWDLLPMHQPALDGVDCGLRPVANAHFIEHAAHMDAYSFLGNMQLLSDITVALSTGDAGKDLMLAGSQFDQRGPLCQAVARDRRQIAQASMHLSLIHI